MSMNRFPISLRKICNKVPDEAVNQATVPISRGMTWLAMIGDVAKPHETRIHDVCGA